MNMKLLKKIVCLLLAASFVLLAACNKGGKNKDSSGDKPGRYVEIDVTPPIDGWFMSFLTADGSLVCFSVGLQMRYDSADGGLSWSGSPGPAASRAINTERYLNIRTGALLPDGRLLAFIQDEGLVLIEPDGNSEHYPVEDIDKAVANGDNVSIMLIQCLGNDRLLLDYMIGGISMQGGRPIGQPNQTVSSPTGEEPGAEASEGEQNFVMQEVTIQGAPLPDGAEPATVFGSGPQGSGPQDSDPQSSGPQSSGPQRATPQSGNSSYNVGTAIGPMSRKPALYELSTGRQISELPVENASAAAADGENLYIMDAQGSVRWFSLSDGSSSSTVALNLGDGGRGGNLFAMPSMVFGGGVLAAAGAGSLYALYGGDLLLCSAGGDVGTVLEGTAYSIGSPNSTASSVFVLDDGSLVVSMLENMQSTRLYKYVWDENAGIDPAKTLTVWSLEENAFVRAAISELRKKNPDSYITYEIAAGGSSAVSVSDAVKTLNTRLLNGSGPDVIILDGCPADSYADRGILLELSGLLDTGAVYQNLLSAYVNDGKMYCLPTQFLVPVLMGSADALDRARTLNDLVNVVVSGNDTPVLRPGGGGPFGGVPEDERSELYFEDLEELCNIMWMSGAPAIIRENRLDTDSLSQYLHAIKSISDKYSLADADEGSAFGIGIAFSSGGRATALSGSLVRYTSQITNYGAYSAGNLMLLQVTMDRGGSSMELFPGLVPGAWRPSTIAGISSDTEVADFAVEFLKAALSVEVQQINYGEGLPVTREGIAAQIKSMNDMLTESEREPFDVDMDALIGRLDAPSVDDIVLTDMMWATVERLCKGETDVEGAVKEIEQNVKNYLAERA